jgi:hypothetical protein
VFPKTIAIGDKTEEEKKSKTESVSFRIERSVLDDLRNESTQKVESLNVLVNQIFRFYFDSHKPWVRAGNTYFPKALISKIFDFLSDGQIAEVAGHLTRDIKEMTETGWPRNREYDPLEYINALCSWLDVSGFPYTRNKTNSSIIMTIRLDMSEKYCTFFGKFQEIVFREFKLEDSIVKVKGNVITLVIQT